MSKNSARFAGIWIFLAAVTFSFSGVLGKQVPWSALSLVGARALVAVIEMGIVRRSFRARLTKGNLLAGACVTLTSLLFMAANKLTTSANAIVLQYAMPAVVILLCALFLRQMPTRLDIIACVLVLFGVALCFADGFNGGNIVGDALALLSAVTYAMVFFCARREDCDPFEYTYLGNVMSCVFLVNLFFDPKVTPSWDPILSVVIMGVILSTGYLMFSRGMKHTSPVTAAILSNAEPVLNPIWTFLALGERPGYTAIIGACMVLLTVTGYSLLSQRRAEKPGMQPDAPPA